MDIFSIFTNLQYLNFVPYSIQCKLFSFDCSLPIDFSSNLLELHIYVKYWNDCLYLLDGHFDKLRTFYVYIDATPRYTIAMNNQVNYFIYIKHKQIYE